MTARNVLSPLIEALSGREAILASCDHGYTLPPESDTAAEEVPLTVPATTREDQP